MVNSGQLPHNRNSVTFLLCRTDRGTLSVGALIVSPLGIDAEIRALYGLCLPSFPLFRAGNRTNSRKSRRNVRTNTPRFCLMHVVNLATGSAGANRRKQGADNVLR